MLTELITAKYIINPDCSSGLKIENSYNAVFSVPANIFYHIKSAEVIPDFKTLLAGGRTYKFEANSLPLPSYLRVFTLQWSAPHNREKLQKSQW